MAHPGCVWLEKLLQYLGRPTRCMSALHASLVPNQGMRASPSGAGCLQGMLRPSHYWGPLGAESMRSTCGQSGHARAPQQGSLFENTFILSGSPSPCYSKVFKSLPYPLDVIRYLHGQLPQGCTAAAGCQGNGEKADGGRRGDDSGIKRIC